MELVCEHAKVTRVELKRLVVAGFKGAFFDGTFAEKRDFVKAAIARYDKLSAQHFPAAKAA